MAICACVTPGLPVGLGVGLAVVGAFEGPGVGVVGVLVGA